MVESNITNFLPLSQKEPNVELLVYRWSVSPRTQLLSALAAFGTNRERAFTVPTRIVRRSRSLSAKAFDVNQFSRSGYDQNPNKVQADWWPKQVCIHHSPKQWSQILCHVQCTISALQRKCCLSLSNPVGLYLQSKLSRFTWKVLFETLSTVKLDKHFVNGQMRRPGV